MRHESSRRIERRHSSAFAYDRRAPLHLQPRQQTKDQLKERTHRYQSPLSLDFDGSGRFRSLEVLTLNTRGTLFMFMLNPPACMPRRATQQSWLRIVAAITLTVSAASCTTPQPTDDPSTADSDINSAARVTGIGGLFFKSKDPGRTLDWYREHLGIDAADWGGYAFRWGDHHEPGQTGYTVWGAFPDSTNYFDPGEQSFMINFRVVDLTGLIASLKEGGVEVVGEVEEHPNGKFAWILDSDGRKIELWEPVDSAEDPYLDNR